MPGATPIFGITYPCSGETIDPAAFQSNADTTQAALTTVAAQDTNFRRPPSVMVRQPSGLVTIPAGVATLITYTSVVYDTNAMFTSATTLTIPSPGTYMVNYQFINASFPTTLSSLRTAILLNGAEVAYNKSDEGSTAFEVDPNMWVSALLPSLTGGNTITTNALFTGTGNMGYQTILSAIRISTV